MTHLSTIGHGITTTVIDAKSSDFDTLSSLTPINCSGYNKLLITYTTSTGWDRAGDIKVYGSLTRDSGYVQYDTGNLLSNPYFADSDGDNLPDFWALRNTPTLVIATDTLFPARGGNQVTITATGQIYEGIIITGGAANWLKVLPSTFHALSFDYKVNAGDTMKVDVSSYNDAAQGTRHINVSLGSTTTVRQTDTFTTDADANNLSINLLAKGDGDIVIVAHPKLEADSVVTPFKLNNSVFTVITSDTGKYYIVDNIMPYVKVGWDNRTAGSTGTITVEIMPFNF